MRSRRRNTRRNSPFAPWCDSDVEKFISYLELKPHGVRLPARLDGDRPSVPAPRGVEFSAA